MHDEIANKELEKIYQAERASAISQIKPTPPDRFERYRKAKWWRFFEKEYVFRTFGNLEGKVVCDFGCGDGVMAVQLAKLGAQVTAFDISSELIEVAKNRAAVDGVEDRIEHIVADAEELQLPVERFDFLLSYDVLHHVDISRVMPIIVTSLKPGGKAVVVEPITYSPLLKKLRNFIPVKKDAGPNDRQLTYLEVKQVGEYFQIGQSYYFRLFGRFARILPKFWIVRFLLNAFDRLLLTLFPPLNRYCGVIVFVCTKSDAIKKKGEKKKYEVST